MATTFKITIAYDGSRFVGWQRQANGTSVQELIEDALKDLDQRDVTVVGAGRTDAGVHALGQVAGFSLSREISPDALVAALNAHLPADIRIVGADEKPSSFHARFDAHAKTYRYRIWNADVLSPFERTYAWHVQSPLDVDAMHAAARLLEGRHDFAAFRAAGGAFGPSDREVFASRVNAVPAGAGDIARVISYEITGSGFLRYMVRAIVGSLVEIGRGRRDAAWLGEVVQSRDRARAGPTAPPQGLFLVGVDYERAAQ